LAEFAHACLENVDVLNDLNIDMWSHKACHAIFGPTDFLEVTRFLADHDRLHVQHAWKTLKSLQA